MEIVLEVPDKDAARVLELIRGIKRVKVKSPSKPLTNNNLEFIEDLKEASRELACAQRGEEIGRPAREILAELKNEL
jgi:hypothetical protein